MALVKLELLGEACRSSMTSLKLRVVVEGAVLLDNCSRVKLRQNRTVDHCPQHEDCHIPSHIILPMELELTVF